MPKFTYKNHQVHYERYGEPGHYAITIVNGLAMRTSHWAPYFKILPSMGYQVLTYDLLGQGLSGKPVLGVDFDDHAACLAALHEHLGIDRPYVMGISFGGLVVLKYACNYVDKIAGLIPVSTFSELDPHLKYHAFNLHTGLSRVGFEFFLDLLMPFNFTGSWLAENVDLVKVIRRVGANTSELFGIQNLMESLQKFEGITGELSRIRCPTLILNGEYDALTTRATHEPIRLAISNSQLWIVPRMCHAMTLEIPQLVSQFIQHFIGMVESGRWQGDQSVWITSEDPQATELVYAFPGDHLRLIPSKRL